MKVLAAATPYTIPNPLGPNSDFSTLFGRLSTAIFDVAIVLAVVMYVWAGVLYLTAGAKPANVAKAKTVMLYTTIGLVVIFFAGGFVDLIRSILNAGQ